MLCCRLESWISELRSMFVDRFWPLLCGPVGCFPWAFVPPPLLHPSFFFGMNIHMEKNYVPYFKSLFIDLIFPAHYGPGANPFSNRNEYEGYLLGGQDGQCVGMTTLPSSHVDFLEILGASMSWSCKGLCMPVMGWLILNPSVLHATPWINSSTEGSKSAKKTGMLCITDSMNNNLCRTVLARTGVTLNVVIANFCFKLLSYNAYLEWMWLQWTLVHCIMFKQDHFRLP